MNKGSMMEIGKCLFKHGLTGLCAVLIGSVAVAQDYPNKPIRFIIPFAAGGSSDLMGRYFAKELSAELGQPIVVENRVGATGVIGLNLIAASPPDGYTLLQFSNTTAVAHYAQNKPFEIDKVMTTIGNFNSSISMMIVNPKVIDVKSLPELLKYVAANPGTDYTSSGAGSPGDMLIASMAKSRNLKMTHIGYSGEGPAMRDVLAGRVGMIVTSGVTAKPHIESGALRVVSSVSSNRSIFAPNVATTTEDGMPDVKNDSLTGVVGPPNLPAPIANRLRAAVRKVTTSEVFRQFLHDKGNINKFIDGPEFRTAIIEDYERWGRIIRESQTAAK